MTIKIDLPSPTVAVIEGKPLKLFLADSGKARVSMNISIGKDISIDYEETWSGSRETIIPALPSGTYQCFVFVYVFRSGLGATHDSTYKINGQVVATSKGTLNEGVFNDGGNAKFKLVIS